MSWTQLFRRRERMMEDLDQDIRDYIERETQDNIGRGMPPEEAHHAALRKFGNVTRIKEEAREVWSFLWLEQFGQDVRFGLRMLAKNPGFTAASVLALAIGLAANTVIFTAYDAVELRPIQATDPERIVNIDQSGFGVRNGQLFSYPAYVYYRDHNTTFSSLIAATGTDLALDETSEVNGPARMGARPSSLFGIRFFQQLAGRSKLTLGAIVSENYFPTLGIHPALGRIFAPDDARSAYPTVMLSYNFWSRSLSSDAAIVGKTIKLNGKSFNVIGITPQDFMGTYSNIPNVWLPVSSLRWLEPGNNMLGERENDCCQVFGRLRPGVTREQAQTELTVLSEQLRKTYPVGSAHRNAVTIAVTPGSPFGTGERSSAKSIGLILMGATALVLLIACGNVAALQLARSAGRQKEFGVRLTLGAGRIRLLRQLLTEATMLAVMAGAVGLLFAWGAMRLLLTTISTALPDVWGSIALQIDPDLRVLAYTLLVCFASAVVFGLAPALQASTPNLTSVLKEEGTALGFRLTKSRLREVLLAGQMAISLTLLVAAGLLAHASFQAMKIDPGFEAKKVLGIDVEIPTGLGYDATKRGLIVRELADRFGAVAGVISLARGRVPLGGGVRSAAVSLDKWDEKPNKTAPSLSYSYVSPDYFTLLQIPIVRGRGFTADEARARAAVVVVSDLAARKLWPQQEPIGKSVILDATQQFHSSDEPFPTGQSFRIIGVAREVSSNWLGKLDNGYVYLPMPPDQWYDTMLLRTEGDPNGVISALSSQANSVDPNVIVFAETLDGLMTNNPPFVFSRIAAVASVIIGLLGVLLASVGIYGMASFAVVQRIHEVGVRMALGARPREVLLMILRQSMKPVIVGMVIGIMAAAAAARLLSALLFGLSSLDPLTFLGVPAALCLVALLASFIPARRAMKVDPMVALRYE